MNPQPFPPDTVDGGSTYGGDDAALSSDAAGGAMDSGKGVDSGSDSSMPPPDAGDGGLDAPVDVVVDALLDAEDAG